ncbi:hypothetical protein [Vallitalea guaymasensis]
MKGGKIYVVGGKNSGKYHNIVEEDIR